MIGTVEFIKSAGSMTTAEYPLLSSDADMDAYVVKTYENVMFVEDLAQTLTMPSFEGWSECNMVRFKQSLNSNPWVAYYWITDAVRSSDVDGATVFNLEFNPIATLLKKDGKLDGIWLRSPFNYTPWKQQAVASGVMGLSRKEELGGLMPKWTIDGLQHTVWVSITATKDPDATQGTYELYGFPAVVSQFNTAMQSLYYSGDAYRIHSMTKDSEGNYLDFPLLNDIFTGDSLTAIGLTTAEILDISITPYAPFVCDVAWNTLDDGTSRQNFGIKGVLGAFSPDPVQVQYNDGTKDTLSKYGMYNLTSSRGYWAKPLIQRTDLTISEMEYSSGQIVLMRGDGSILNTIPTGYFELGMNNNYDVVLASRVLCDFCQIIMEIGVYAPSDLKTPLMDFTLPCTHIPYIGNQWDNYRAYSMSYDREAMEFNLDQAKSALIFNSYMSMANAATGAIMGFTGAALTGGATAMNGASLNAISSVQSAGMGVISNIFAYAQQKEAAQFNQNLTERQTQTQPGNAYGASYGLFNLAIDIETPMTIGVTLPIGLTEDIFNEFIEDFGYANEGAKELDITYGFYQGTIRTSPTLTGPRLASLINAFNAGVRLIPVGGKT